MCPLGRPAHARTPLRERTFCRVSYTVKGETMKTETETHAGKAVDTRMEARLVLVHCAIPRNQRRRPMHVDCLSRIEGSKRTSSLQIVDHQIRLHRAVRLVVAQLELALVRTHQPVVCEARGEEDPNSSTSQLPLASLSPRRIASATIGSHSSSVSSAARLPSASRRSALSSCWLNVPLPSTSRSSANASRARSRARCELASFCAALAAKSFRACSVARHLL